MSGSSIVKTKGDGSGKHRCPHTSHYGTGPAEASAGLMAMRVTLSLPLPVTLGFPPQGLCGVGEEERGGRRAVRQVLTAMPWPKPEPGCGLAALM